MQQGTYKHAIRTAFPYTMPVLMGYLFIGIAFGVMYQEKGYGVLWATLMSILVYAGSGQYLAISFFVPGMQFASMVFLTFMVNVRHIFYGLSLLTRFENMKMERWYMIFSLTDETYSLYFNTKVPPDVKEERFLFAIAFLNHLYWVVGSIIGSVAGTLIPFNDKGIDFAMTALFLVIFVEQWLAVKSHFPALAGIGAAFACLLIFGKERFILPSMICIMILLLLFRGNLEDKERIPVG